MIIPGHKLKLAAFYLYSFSQLAGKQTPKGRMDSHTLDILEYHELLRLIGGYAATMPGQSFILGLLPQDSIAGATRFKPLLTALLQLENQARPLPRTPFDDVAPAMRRARPQAAVLAGDELMTCKKQLHAVAELKKFTRQENATQFPALVEFIEKLAACPELLQQLTLTLDDDGTLLDHASPELMRIRRQTKALEQRIRARLDTLLHGPEAAETFQEQFVTLRNDRYVVPVRREVRGHFTGIVHDHSDSGRTLFMEPGAIVPLGNELADLRLDERDEVRRILADLSALVRRRIPDLIRNQRRLAELDGLAGVAVWARLYACELPRFGTNLRLISARHPLLARQFQAENRQSQVVPLNLQLPADQRALVITGSNSGGKTVAIKTIGLLTLMAQAGLPVPAATSSEFEIFHDVLADIGDEQSLAANLSTFTGHLTRLAEILRKLPQPGNHRTLVILDELGTGTDPLEGGALACAMLAEMAEHNALTLATTHLGVIKSFVHERPDMTNAAVRFNLQTLVPEYILDVGQPGASHALAIAERVGINQTVLARARTFLDSDQLQLEKILAHLEDQQRLADQRDREMHEALEKTRQNQAQITSELEKLRRERRQLLHEAYQQASQIVANTRRQMEHAIAEMPDAETRRLHEVELKNTRQLLTQRTEKIDAALRQTAPRPRQPLPLEKLHVGDKVWVEKLRDNARLKAINPETGRITVTIGHVDFTINAEEIGRREADTATTPPPIIRESRPRLSGKAPTEINLIGMRVYDAMPRLEQFITTAATTGLPEARVIHGFGTGRLQKAVHEYLKTCPLVKQFRLGDPEHDPGGAGTTIVQF